MARVLVVGCGYVGTALAVRLASDGHEVFGLRRSEGALPAGVSLVRGDVTDASSLRALPRPIDRLVYTVAADGSSEAAYRSAYVDGLRNVIAAVRERDAVPQRLVVVTSTAVYGQDAGEWVDEDSPTEPTRFQGRILLESEGVALGCGIPAVVVRLGGIYGPGRTRLIDQVRRGEAQIPTQPMYTNRIHRDDCAGVLRHVMNLDRPQAVYVGVDCDPADYRDVVTWLAERLAVPGPHVASDGEGSSVRGKRCRSDRLVTSKYDFVYPSFREGYDSLIRSA
jgi:nucleoside-diphosphate-sugar epimerase